jgi:6-pyruvoyltetrahydropterin/6-carboxytetrahydropterin synthase
MISIERYHDFSCGHRVCGHETKCRHLHGHNYRVTFTCQAERLDSIGRVVDFSVLKSTVCEWLEIHWDHKMLLWEHDPVATLLLDVASIAEEEGGVNPSDYAAIEVGQSIVKTTFNPTAENMAHYLLHVVSPACLVGTGVTVFAVKVEETRKCSATALLLDIT